MALVDDDGDASLVPSLFVASDLGDVTCMLKRSRRMALGDLELRRRENSGFSLINEE